MKRWILLLSFLLASGTLLAKVTHQVPCGVVAAGGGFSTSTSFSVFSTAGMDRDGMEGRW